MIPSTVASTIHIEQPSADASLAETMSSIRSWLDSHDVEPLDFKSIVSDAGVGFEIRFRRAEDAELFRSTFGKSNVGNQTVGIAL